MLGAVDIYNDVFDAVKPAENGAINIEEYNRKSRIAENRLNGWLTGGVEEGDQVPEPYNTQKLKDWLSERLKIKTDNVTSGTIKVPEDYYSFERMAIIGNKEDELCDGVIKGKDTTIDLLTSQQWDARCNNKIKSLRPSMKLPIAKKIGREFHFLPKDLGSITLTYKATPVYGELTSQMDDVHNIEIPVAKNNYDWPEFARDILVYFISKQYGRSTREKALQEQNELLGKTERK